LRLARYCVAAHCSERIWRNSLARTFEVGGGSFRRTRAGRLKEAICAQNNFAFEWDVAIAEIPKADCRLFDAPPAATFTHFDRPENLQAWANGALFAPQPRRAAAMGRLPFARRATAN
jgi:hypothetical protein